MLIFYVITEIGETFFYLVTFNDHLQYTILQYFLYRHELGGQMILKINVFIAIICLFAFKDDPNKEKQQVDRTPESDLKS